MNFLSIMNNTHDEIYMSIYCVHDSWRDHSIVYVTNRWQDAKQKSEYLTETKHRPFWYEKKR